MRVSFLGLGRMGLPMADRLLDAGFDLTLYNRTKEKADPLLSKGAHWSHTPGTAAKECDVVVTMVADDAALESLMTGPDGILDSLPEHAIHLSCSSISMAFSKHLDALHTARGQEFVSAPVFGRPDAVIAGNLRLLCAGGAEPVARVRPLLDALGIRVFPLGELPWTANLVKLAGNFMIASALEALSESFTLVQKAGIDPGLFLDIVDDSLFRSPLYRNYGGIMARQQFSPPGFTMDLGLKDANLVLESANSLQVPLPLAGIIRDAFLAGLAHGRQPLDWSAILFSSMDRAGIGENP